MHRLLKYTFTSLLLAQPCLAAGGGDTAVFWSVDGPQGHAGYLLGTVHSEDARVLDYSDEFLEALQSCDVFAMELVPDLPTLARLTQFMHLPEGVTQADVIGAERFQAVAEALSHYGLPAEQVARMKPWASMMTLSVPPPKTGLFMDFSLSLRAAGSGLRVIGLETLEDQLSFLEDLALPQQLVLLDHAVAEFDQVLEVHESMVSTYLEGDLDGLARLADEQMATLDADIREYFVGAGIHARNRRMLSNLIPELRNGRVFTAVGALHLPGEQGLIALLRTEGYVLKPLRPPFAATSEHNTASAKNADPQAGSIHTVAKPGTRNARAAFSQSPRRSVMSRSRPLMLSSR